MENSCVAAAEDNNELDEYVVWFASSKGNLTKAVYHDTYKHAGLKSHLEENNYYGDVSHTPVDQKSDISNV